MKGRSLKSIAHHFQLSSDVEEPVTGFAIDSRAIARGELFFALKGEMVDGHDFLSQVAERGALAAVVSQEYQGEAFGLHLLRVEDVQQALQKLAKVAFSKRKERVVGITGSMGKTTTKEFLAHLLEGSFRVAKTPGNWNTQLTLPLFLLNLEGEFDVLVLEMGMSGKGQIRRLVEMAPPDYAMVTRIAHAGIAGGGLTDIAEAKGEIFSSPRTALGMVSSQAAPFFQGKKIYGPGGDFVLKRGKKGVQIHDSPWMEVPLEAEHLLENFLGAAAMARILGVSWHAIGKRASDLQPFDKRFEKIERDGVLFFQDCYNANPESMRVALENLSKPKGEGRVIGVLGEMVDLGGNSEAFHRQVGEFATAHLDELLSVGEGGVWTHEAFSASGKEALHCRDVIEAKEALKALLRKGDVVLIKGANRLKLWEILEE